MEFTNPHWDWDWETQDSIYISYLEFIWLHCSLQHQIIVIMLENICSTFEILAGAPIDKNNIMVIQFDPFGSHLQFHFINTALTLTTRLDLVFASSHHPSPQNLKGFENSFSIPHCVPPGYYCLGNCAASQIFVLNLFSSF